MPERTPTPSHDPRVEQVRSLAYLLDSSIALPGTRWRIGWDAILGLLPGVGDATGAVLSGYIVLQAARLGAPAATLARMVGNVAVETIVGAVPLLGDVFDAAWKANRRNLALLEDHLRAPGRAARVSRGWVAGVALALLALLVGGAVLVVWIAAALLRALGIG